MHTHTHTHTSHTYISKGFPGGASAKEPACQCRRHKRLEEGIVTHSSILAWRIPWREEPGGLQSTGVQKVREDLRDLACREIKTVSVWSYLVY